ncbi:helix-turn-helix domain-containing protein [Anaerospora hongkongensis]|uniref:helix-turn-helix domain-containing protein n=1 Tax=Anaerospora hongkongensis TaxID=244830 RepID=UPI0028971F79|nr:helix-turn-helix transcriptional regulator [Anaerospora hongkongensis]
MKTDMALQRLKQGYTLTAMAKLLGISKAYLSSIENSFMPVPQNRIEDFKKYYGG